MADNSLAIATEYVRNFTAFMRTEISWPEAVLSILVVQKLDMSDVLDILKHGTVVECEKEMADEAEMVSEGYTGDAVRLRVCFWVDINQVQLRVRSVQRI